MNMSEWIKAAYDSSWGKLLMLAAAAIAVGSPLLWGRGVIADLYHRVPQEVVINGAAILFLAILWGALFRRLRRVESGRRLAKAMTVREPRGACTVVHVFARNDRVRLGAPDGAQPFIYLRGDKPDEFYLKSSCYVDLLARPQSFKHFEVAVSIPPVTDAEREEAVGEFTRAQDNLDRDFRVWYAYTIPRQDQLQRLRDEEKKTVGDELKRAQADRQLIEREIERAEADKVRLFDERKNREKLQKDTEQDARRKTSRMAQISILRDDNSPVPRIRLWNKGGVIVLPPGGTEQNTPWLFHKNELDTSRWVKVRIDHHDGETTAIVEGYGSKGDLVRKQWPGNDAPENERVKIPWSDRLQVRLQVVSWTTHPTAFLSKPVAW